MRVAPSSVHWEIGNALSAMVKRKAIERDDAYVIACAVNQRAPILSLDKVLVERARSLKLETLGVTGT